MKVIPEDKIPCKSCTTPNLCTDSKAWSSCKLQKKIKYGKMPKSLKGLKPLKIPMVSPISEMMYL